MQRRLKQEKVKNGCDKCADPEIEGEHTCGKKTNKSQGIAKDTPLVNILTVPVGTIIPEYSGIIESFLTRKPKNKEITEYTVVSKAGSVVIQAWGKSNVAADDGKLLIARNVSVTDYKGTRQYTAENIEIK